jgi:hypothetical protein
MVILLPACTSVPNEGYVVTREGFIDWHRGVQRKFSYWR